MSIAPAGSECLTSTAGLVAVIPLLMTGAGTASTDLQSGIAAPLSPKSPGDIQALDI